MRGIFPKQCVGHKTLACQSCIWFRDHDVDIYYCELDKAEFPEHCKDFEEKEVNRDV